MTNLNRKIFVKELFNVAETNTLVHDKYKPGLVISKL